MKAWVDYLQKSWGLSDAFAKQVALLIAWLNYYGLNPRIASGFRDPKKQAALRARWDRGDRAGLRERPALDSLHTRESWTGGPEAEAIDIDTRDDHMAARIAQHLKIGAGIFFRTPDPGHFYELNTR
jgi:hypothetical protein